MRNDIYNSFMLLIIPLRKGERQGPVGTHYSYGEDFVLRLGKEGPEGLALPSARTDYFYQRVLLYRRLC